MARQSSKIQRPKKINAFLAAYSECGTLTKAAEIAGIDRNTHYDWLKKVTTYPDEFKAAEAQACDRLEQEARRRAVEGVDDPVFHKGEKVAEVRKYSDTLLIFLLKGAMPEKYRERFDNRHSGELTTKGHVVIELPDNGREPAIAKREKVIKRAANRNGDSDVK